MQIIIQVAETFVSSLQGREPRSPATEELLRTAEQLGITLRPMHEGVQVGALAQYYSAEIPDRDSAQHVISRLQACEAVQAAYMKPPAALP